MSILIKGMEMPICRTCPCSEEKLYGNLCRITNEIVPFSFDRGDKCPLIEVPPHGRLIDADELPRYSDDVGYLSIEQKLFNEAIDDAPTIIEAEVQDD